MPDSPTLVIDAGSSSVRARLVAVDGRVIATASRPHAYANDPDAGDLARAFDLPKRWASIADAAREAATLGARPASIAITSQRQSLVFLDAGGRPLYTGPNTDLRAVFQGAALDAEYGDAIYQTTGHRPAFMMASGKLAWLRDARPADYARVAHILPLADWIAWKLTGEIGCEPSLAAASGLLDIHARRWASTLFADLGLRCPETPLRDASEPRGSVVSADIPALSGVPVFVAGADTQCALTGMGVADAGQAGIVAGWSATTQIALANPVMSGGMNTWTGLFPTRRLWTLESVAGDMGNAWRWLAETLFGGKLGYDEMDALAASAPLGSDGVVASLGPRAMDLSALGMRLGGIAFPVPLTLGGPTRAQICRAALESFAYAIRASLESAEREAGVEATRIAFGGGMARSTTLSRILPNVLGRPLTIYPNHDPTAVGAAGAQPLAGTQIEPNPTVASQYRDLYHRWEDAQQRHSPFPLHWGRL